MNKSLSISQYSESYLQILCIVLIIICTILAIKCADLQKKSRIPEKYADCMADTYFYGYLKKIVPDHGLPGGLKNKIMLYKAMNNLNDEEFPFEKMFILIPSSGYIPSLLSSIDPERIELRQPLESTKLNRAGVNARSYDTSVYKILFRDNSCKHISVVMEGAPPLLVLSDSCKENAELRKYKKDLIYLFYIKLKAMLEESSEFENACELLYYDEDKMSLADELLMRYLEGY